MGHVDEIVKMAHYGINESGSSNLYETIENILTIIKTARKNKSYASKFTDILKQLLKSLSGIENEYLKQAEFYNDLKETVRKIEIHLVDSTNRGKLVRVMLARKDVLTLEEIKTHVDTLCGRIALSYAERIRQRQNIITFRKPKISFQESVEIKVFN